MSRRKKDDSSGCLIKGIGYFFKGIGILVGIFFILALLETLYTNTNHPELFLCIIVIALVLCIYNYIRKKAKEKQRRIDFVKQVQHERTFMMSHAQYQRSLMSPSLRYDILKRDNFQCQICGRTQNDGVKLHVDHIIPVSKGGLTIPSNLRTLCEDCNLGKSSKYDPNGPN